VSRARELVTGSIGVGFLMPFVSREAVTAAGEQADMVEFFYGHPDHELIQLAGRRGAVVGWRAGSAAEAREAADAGCAYVAAQGTEMRRSR
jgi:nitronate monooxygenase